MITSGELITIANERLSDAEALYIAGRYDAVAYLCGYAIEISLKHRICVTLNWTEFPKTSAEFKNYTCLKTHDLDVLLSFCGIETQIKSTYFEDWSVFDEWTPESRYNQKEITSVVAEYMINSAKKLIPILWKK